MAALFGFIAGRARIDVEQTGDEFFDVEVLLREAETFPLHGGARLRAVNELEQRGRQLGRLARRHEQPVHLREHEVGQAADLRSDDGESARQGFDDGHRHSLVIGGVDENVGGPERRDFFGARDGGLNVDEGFQPVRLRLRFERVHFPGGQFLPHEAEDDLMSLRPDDLRGSKEVETSLCPAQKSQIENFEAGLFRPCRDPFPPHFDVVI